MPGNFHALASWKQKQREIDKRVANMKEKERQMHEDHHASMKAHDAMLEADDEVGFVPGADKTRVMGAAWDKINQEEWGLLTPRTVTGERRVMIKDFQRRCDDRREDMRAADSAYHAHLRDYTERVLELDTEAACVDDSEKIKTQYGSRIVTPHVKMDTIRNADFKRRKDARYDAMHTRARNFRLMKEQLERDMEADDEVGCCPKSEKLTQTVTGPATNPVTGKEQPVHSFTVNRVLSDGVIQGNKLLKACADRKAQNTAAMRENTLGYQTDGRGWQGPKWGGGWTHGPGMEKIDRALEAAPDAGCVPNAYKVPEQPDISEMTIQKKKEYLRDAKIVTPQLVQSLQNQRKWKKQFHQNVEGMREQTRGYFGDGRRQNHAPYTTVSGQKASAFRGLGVILNDLENDDSAGCIDEACVLNMDAPVVERRISTVYTRDTKRREGLNHDIRQSCKRDMRRSTQDYHAYVRSLRQAPFFYNGSSRPEPFMEPLA